MVGTDDNGHRRLTWPTTRIAVASPAGLRPRRHPGPRHRAQHAWRQFCAELLAACDDLGAELVVTLGALLADTPHTRPIPVTGTATEPELVDRLELEQSTYEGPTGIVGVFQDACVQLDIPAVSYWAAVPHYVAQPPCPKATLALLGQLEELLEAQHPARRPPRGRQGLGARRRRARRGGRGRRRLRPRPRGDPRHRRPPRGHRRGDRPRVRALPQAPRPGLTQSASPQRPRRAASAAGLRGGVGVAGVGEAGRPRVASTQPSTRRRRRGGGVEVVGQRGEHRARRPGPRARRRRARARGARRRGCRRRPRAGRRSTPSRCGSGGAAAPAGSPSGRRRCRAARRRRRGCPWTSTSSRRRRRPSRRARRRARTARPGRRDLRVAGATSRGAGRPGRCRRPGRRTAAPRWSQRDRGALDVPARAARARTGCPTTARPSARPRHTRQSSGSFLPVAVGVAAALGEDREHRLAVAAGHVAEGRRRR